LARLRLLRLLHRLWAWSAQTSRALALLAVALPPLERAALRHCGSTCWCWATGQGGRRPGEAVRLRPVRAAWVVGETGRERDGHSTALRCIGSLSGSVGCCCCTTCCCCAGAER